MALVVAGLSIWQLAPNLSSGLGQASNELVVALALAATTVLVAAIGYFATAPRLVQLSARVNYIFLLATLVTMIVQTDGLSSPYFSLLIIALAFAGFFRAAGVTSGLGAYALLVAWQILVNASHPEQTPMVAIIGGLPLAIGFFLWGRSEPSQSLAEGPSYSELASELSQVAGKSEVVINAIDDGVLALDSKGTIRLINPAAQRMLGWGKRDSINLDYKAVFKMLTSKNTEVDYMTDPVAQVLANNKATKSDDLNLQTQSGKNFMAAISVNPVGQPGEGVIVVFRDITTERSDERQRAEFISTASHEMRTPVASIEGYLGLTLNPTTATIDDRARDFITKAHESAQHLGHLFQDLLDVSKADDGRLANNPTVIDVAPFLHGIVQGLTPKAAEKGLGIIYKPIPDSEDDELARRLNPVYYVNVDADHLREVSDNLIENAIKYTPKGNVVIDVGGDPTHVVISIQDTGIGIPREDQAHLFQKFYRVDNSDTREIGGTGLGLYLCRRLVETMNGRIWVESEYKKGSTFYVELPRIDHDDATRMIEQASILAEQRAQAEAAQAAKDAEAAAAAQIAAMKRTNTFVPSVSGPVLTPPQAPVSPQPTPAAQPAPAPQPPLASTPLNAIGATPTIHVPPRPTTVATPQKTTWRQ